MIIKPGLSISDYPVFEITEIEIPEVITQQINTGEWVSYNHNKPSDQLYHPSGRSKMDVTPELRTLALYVSRQVGQYINKQKDYNINNEFPEYYLTKKDLQFFGVEYVRDDPGYDMGKHLDNRLMFGTLIINLADNNKSHTRYYDGENSRESIYNGPSSKGTGAFHINTRKVYHDGVNKGDGYRYIALINYMIC
jgi:hypothetical protein